MQFETTDYTNDLLGKQIYIPLPDDDQYKSTSSRVQNAPRLDISSESKKEKSREIRKKSAS